MTKLQLKWAGVLVLVAGSLFILSGTVEWYSLTPQERQSREAFRDRPKMLLNLGLDLKGGTHLVMELDQGKLPPDADLQDAMSRAIETIRNRVDQFGVAEPLIARQGKDMIVVQLPGISNPQQAKELMGKTALLEFRMADTSEAAQKAMQKLAELGSPFAREGRLDNLDKGRSVTPEAAKLLPPGTVLLPGRRDEAGDSYFIVSASVPLTGAALKSARVETGGDYGLPIVAFGFSPEGGRVFGALTTANVGKNLAIVLDGVVYSAPVIKGPIRGGSGIIEGNFSIDEARRLAIVLRSGALPAPIRIIEERTVGPTLGEDSVRAGLLSCLAGAALIFGFLVVYYRLSGVMAILSLTANILFLLAAMAYFGSTLTLPGFVGIVLTLAMSIDANVLIFERIREELRAGKPVRLAVDAGYDKAASAILDSNLTLLIASVLLFQFGTGPIKGFAVTLSLGNIFSMFTATVVTRLMHQAWLANRDVETVSI